MQISFSNNAVFNRSGGMMGGGGGGGINTLDTVPLTIFYHLFPFLIG